MEKTGTIGKMQWSGGLNKGKYITENQFSVKKSKKCDEKIPRYKWNKKKGIKEKTKKSSEDFICHCCKLNKND